MIANLVSAGPSMRVLHNTYAKRGRIDDRAPISARLERRISAPPTEVWALLIDPYGWPAIDPAIHDVRLDSTPAEDVRFLWSNGKARISSQFAVIDPERELTWTGTSWGTRAVHRHLLQPTDGDATTLRCEESMSGPLLRLLFSSAQLHTTLAAWMEHVKNAAERNWRTPGGRPSTSTGRRQAIPRLPD